METIGERVRRVREDLGISRADLAKQIGAKGESYISELELGGIKKGGRLHQIADALGVSVRWLETGKGEQSPSAPVSGQSQGLRLNPVILAESIAALRQVAKRRGWSYDPGLHAETTCYAYELWQLLPTRPSTADVIDIGERIAERLRREVEGMHAGGQQGAHQGAGKDDRGQSREGSAEAASSTGRSRSA